MKIMDFGLRELVVNVVSFPTRNVTLSFQINHQNGVNRTASPNGLYYVDHTTNITVTQKDEAGADKKLIDMVVRYNVFLDLEGASGISEKGQAEGDYVTKELRPAIFSEINANLAKVRFPMLPYANYN